MKQRHSHAAQAAAIRTILARDACRRIGCRPSEAELMADQLGEAQRTLQALADNPDVADLMRQSMVGKLRGAH